MGRFPPDFKAIVAKEQGRTAGYVWAAREPGLSACRFEATIPGREYIDISGEDLTLYPMHTRWVMGVFIVDQSDMGKPLAWAAKLDSEDRRRVVFLLSPDLDERFCQDLIAEAAPGCRFDIARGLGSAADADHVHAQFGLVHARQAYDDRGLED